VGMGRLHPPVHHHPSPPPPSIIIGCFGVGSREGTLGPMSAEIAKWQTLCQRQRQRDHTYVPSKTYCYFYNNPNIIITISCSVYPYNVNGVSFKGVGFEGDKVNVAPTWAFPPSGPHLPTIPYLPPRFSSAV
jgi:hypothetical protein